MTKTIPEGLHARFEHCRNYQAGPFNGMAIPLDPRGGTTSCYIEDEDNNVVAHGYAKCARAEQYNKKIGRDISLGRALKAYETFNVTRPY